MRLYKNHFYKLIIEDHSELNELALVFAIGRLVDFNRTTLWLENWGFEHEKPEPVEEDVRGRTLYTIQRKGIKDILHLGLLNL